MNDWEERMSAKHRPRYNGIFRMEDRSPDEIQKAYGTVFSEYFRESDPFPIIPKILAARCLGIEYGDPGPKLKPEMCRQCWGDRHVWLGNCWGLKHTGRDGLSCCDHECHQGEVWMG